MPPKRRSSITPGDDYESDGGFIEDAPKSKKAKTSKTPKNKRENNPSEGEAATGGGEVGKDGEVFWEVSRSPGTLGIWGLRKRNADEC